LFEGVFLHIPPLYLYLQYVFLSSKVLLCQDLMMNFWCSLNLFVLELLS